jgi:DNA-binding NarL/FixJ family response regulator
VAILFDALRRIADGETVVDPTIVARLFGRRRRYDPLAELTDRECEVLGRRRRSLQPRDRVPPHRHRALSKRTSSRSQATPST